MMIEVLAEGNTNDIIFASQNSISNRIKSKESCRYFINMLVMAFEDAINIKNQKNAFLESYATILETLANKLSHLDESLIELLKCSGVINDAVNLGVEKKDAELLSYFYNDGELIKEILDDKESNDAFFTAKECFEEVLKLFDEGDNSDVVYYAHSKLINEIKSKESCRYFVNMLVMAFEDMINIQNQKNVFLESYATILENLASKLSHLDESLIELLKCNGIINTNVNIPLLLDHLLYTITKED